MFQMNRDMLIQMAEQFIQVLRDSQYPTKEEILNSPFDFPTAAIEVTKSWRHECYKNWTKFSQPERHEKLSMLLHALNTIFGGRKLAVELTLIPKGDRLVYLKRRGIIQLSIPVSVVSSLHELGHHLFGRSELQACRFSVHLFKECFPKTYNNLTWNGHLLVRKTKKGGTND